MHIVVGYDGSNEAKRAVRIAIKHAKAFDGKISVITSLKGETGEPSKDIIKARENLEHAATFIKDLGIPCEAHFLNRDMEPGEDLVQFAEDHNADEIVIGIKKRSKVQKLLLGSNAQYVILHAPCTVVSTK